MYLLSEAVTQWGDCLIEKNYCTVLTPLIVRMGRSERTGYSKPRGRNGKITINHYTLRQSVSTFYVISIFQNLVIQVPKQSSI